MAWSASPDEGVVAGAPGRGAASAAESAAAVGKWAGQLAAYGLVTVVITFLLLKPSGGSGKRGRLFFGSGILVVLVKNVLGEEPQTSAVAKAGKAVKQVEAKPAAKAQTSYARERAVQQSDTKAGSQYSRSVPATKNEVRATEVLAPAAPSPRKRPAGADAPPVNDARPKKSAAAPAAGPTKSAAPPLGPRFVDRRAGFSLQFPAGWSQKAAGEAGWLLDATDGQSAVISVGFSKFPADVTADQIPLERVTKGLQKRAGTVVHASGYTTLGGRRCLWHKFTGPVTRGGATPKVTAVHYFLPLQDGRALELRVAAAPEKFNEVGPRMKQSVDSFKLLTKVADAGAR